MKTLKYYITVVLHMFFVFAHAQIFFETAKDDGVISFTQKKVSQIKFSPSSTAITYGYSYLRGDSRSKTRLILNGELKAKPNDDGIAALIKTGNLQPGVMANGAVGVRIINSIKPFFSAFDFYIKPSFGLTGYTIYDSIRGDTGSNPVYKKTKSSFDINVLMNGVLSPWKVNIFFGLQYGQTWTSNGDDLDKGTVQTVIPYAGSSTQNVFTNVKEVKYGQLKNIAKNPFKADLIFDPGIRLNHTDATNTRLGLFGYYRTDGRLKKYRTGFGFCFLDATNPSRIFSSLGYELPTFGADVKPEIRKDDKGMIFFSIGYSIF